MQRITGVDARTKMMKFFTSARIDIILKLCTSVTVNQTLLDVAGAAGKATNYNIEGMSVSVIVMATLSTMLE